MTMRIMAWPRLRAYYGQAGNEAAEKPMRAWGGLVEKSEWENFMDLKQTFPSADLLVGEKVCFDIGGNKWRIIANVAFQPQIVFLAWIGTHREYDKL